MFWNKALSRVALTKSFTVCNFKNTLAMTIIFVSKCLKFDITSRNGTKKSENVFRYLNNCIWIGSRNFSQLRRLYLLSVVSVLTNTPKIFRYYQEKNFPNQCVSDRSKNMIKVLSWRLHKFWEFLNMLAVKGCSEMALSREWSKQVFHSL